MGVEPVPIHHSSPRAPLRVTMTLSAWLLRPSAGAHRPCAQASAPAEKEGQAGHGAVNLQVVLHLHPEGDGALDEAAFQTLARNLTVLGPGLRLP